MQEFESYFRALDLDQTATLDEIKEAYKDLVMVWHPDRFAHNVRLRHKAEEKLKLFNQAYDGLRQWCTEPRQNTSPSRSPVSQPQSAPRGQSGRSPQSHRRPPQKTQSSPPEPPPPQVQTSELYITFAHAAYVLGHYCFKLLRNRDVFHHHYQSGPFLLIVCDEPLSLTLSVPCHSLQHFDRILLSIPCKSTGHFETAEAQQLLQLLQTTIDP